MQAGEREFRDRIAKEWRARDPGAVEHEVARHHYVPAMRAAARRFAAGCSGGQTILDLGVGWGWHWRGIVTPNILAVDFSLESLLVAKNCLGSQVDSNIHLVCADAGALPIATAALAGVWSVQTLQHLPATHLTRALREIRRAMAPGAHAEIHWVQWNLLTRLVAAWVGTTAGKERTRPFCYRMLTPLELRQLLEHQFEAQVRIAYSEVLFHPELRLSHRLPLAGLDRWLAGVPGLNAALAREIVATARM